MWKYSYISQSFLRSLDAVWYLEVVLGVATVRLGDPKWEELPSFFADEVLVVAYSTPRGYSRFLDFALL